MMTEERAIAIFEAYGPEPANWPSNAQNEIQTLLNRSQTLRKALEAVRNLDEALLSDAPHSPMPDDLRRRILAALPARPLRRHFRLAPILQAAALAASFLLGFVFDAASLLNPQEEADLFVSLTEPVPITFEDLITAPDPDS